MYSPGKNYTTPTAEQVETLIKRAEHYVSSYMWHNKVSKAETARNSEWWFCYYGDRYYLASQLTSGSHNKLSTICERNGVDKGLRGLRMLLTDLQAEAKLAQRAGSLWPLVQALRASDTL